MSLRDVIQLCGFLILVGGILYNIVKTITIKDNHLEHLGRDVKSLIQGQEDMLDKIGKNTERIAKIEGKIS